MEQNLEKIQKNIEEIKRFYCNIENIEVVEPIGDYGEIVCKNVTKSFLDTDGNIREYSTYVYNIMLKTGLFVSDTWFDTYDYDCHGNCIIGFCRSSLEISQLMKIPSYCSGEMLCKLYTYKYGAINSQGILAVQPMYDRLTFNNENSYIAYYNGNLGYVSNIDGEHITPIIFPHAQPFFEGYAAVEFNGKMGYVARNRKMRNPNNIFEYAIEPKYETADDFDGGYAEVSLDGSSYIIDKNGNIMQSKPNHNQEKLEQEVTLRKTKNE